MHETQETFSIVIVTHNMQHGGAGGLIKRLSSMPRAAKRGTGKVGYLVEFRRNRRIFTFHRPPNSHPGTRHRPLRLNSSLLGECLFYGQHLGDNLWHI